MPLIQGLLEYWPRDNPLKEKLLLSTLLEAIEKSEVDKIEHLAKQIFRTLIKCIGGQHLEVSHRAMCFFENEYF